MKTFKYLVSTLANDGAFGAEVTNIMQSGSNNWKRVSGGLCDRKISVKIKGKVYMRVVIPELVFGEMESSTG